jgi:hypothetical protein
METKTRTSVKDELLARECEYLRAVEAGDGSAGAGLTAGETLLVSGHGPMRLTPPDIAKMLEEQEGGRQYEFVEDGVEVVEVTPEVAVIAYRLKSRAGGAETEAFDTDVWVKRDGGWRCAVHVETPAQANA